MGSKTLLSGGPHQLGRAVFDGLRDWDDEPAAHFTALCTP
jgi:hypothetical protein